MTLTLNLSPELEQYLARSAQQRGLTLESLTLEILADSMETQPETLLKAGMSCEVWSPYDAFGAAEIMMKVLQDSKTDGNG
jgi:hypothetical protein